MQPLQELIAQSEEWLVNRILFYARRQNYTRYTSTLAEAWHVSIAGLSSPLIEALDLLDGPPELDPDDNYLDDLIASFGILEARRHRTRGITLSMFLGLMKYYRQCYLDLIIQADYLQEVEEDYRLFVNRFFDRVELGFCTEWAALTEGQKFEELRAANRQMTNEKNKYLTIFESLKDPVILFCEDDLPENINQAAAELFAGLDVPGSVYYHQENIEPLTADFSFLIPLVKQLKQQDRREDEIECVFPTCSGERAFQVKLKQMLDFSGKFSGTLVILSDITELNQAQEKVIRAARLSAIGEIAASVAHQVNNPIGAIIGQCYLLLKRLEEGSREYQSISVIQTAAERAGNVVRRLLNLSSTSSTYDMQPLDIGMTLRNALLLLRAQIKPDIHLSVTIPDQLPPVRGSALHLEEMWLNLLINANDALTDKEEGLIEIMVTYDLETVRVCIRDNGVGIEPQHMAHLFDAFFTTKGPDKGTGLGLAVCQDIIAHHDGEITVSSQPGKETIFTVLLPVEETQEKSNYST